MFRKIQKEDKNLFIDLCDEFYSTDAVLHKIPKESMENTFDELISSDRYLECYLFEDNKEVFGYGMIAKTYSPEANGICIWIEEVYIREKFRNAGVGKKFFEYIEKNYKFARLRLELEENNQRAQKLYEKCGYKVLQYKQMYKEI